MYEVCVGAINKKQNRIEEKTHKKIVKHEKFQTQTSSERNVHVNCECFDSKKRYANALMLAR